MHMYEKGVHYDKRMHKDHPFHDQDAAWDADLTQYENEPNRIGGFFNNLFTNGIY